MTTTLIKKKLTSAINEIDDTNFLQALHTIVNAKKEEEAVYQLSAAQKKELDRRQARHRSGESKSHSWRAVKKSLLKK
jgi:putative addiction module component (TIGR02574 family)